MRLHKRAFSYGLLLSCELRNEISMHAIILLLLCCIDLLDPDAMRVHRHTNLGLPRNLVHNLWRFLIARRSRQVCFDFDGGRPLLELNRDM